MHAWLRRLDVELLEYAPRKPLVLMTWAGRDASLPSIMLNSHTDVVPAEASFWRRAHARSGQLCLQLQSAQR